jgi:hypothetical protein
MEEFFMKNMDLRQELRTANVRHWQAADVLGISETTFVIWLRHELSDEKKTRVRKAMEKIVQSRDDHHN